MKKLIAIELVVATIVTAFSVIPTMGKSDGARVVFETDMVLVPPTGPASGQGIVRADGNFKLEMEGTAPNTSYQVLLCSGPTVPSPSIITPILVTSDGSGDFTVEGSIPEDKYGSYGMVRFIVQIPGTPPTSVYQSGITINSVP